MIRDSRGSEAANQQTYLDLGYTDSAAQTHAAEWAAATELPWIISETGVSAGVGKGIMQVASLINRWGVFSHTTLDSTELSLPSLSKHPLEGWTVEQVMQHVNQLGLKTERDQLLLWSGLGKDGVELSQKYAMAHGGVTLEMTLGGKWLNEMDLFGVSSPFSFAEASKIWESISMSTMRLASGQVRSVLGQVNPRSIYSQEIQELLNNDRVLGLEPLFIKPKYIFGK